LPRYKTTSEALKIVSSKEQIRNFGVIAHVDHGKCVDGNSLITLSSGEIRPIREIYRLQNSTSESRALHPGLLLDSMNPMKAEIEDRVASAVWRLEADSLVKVSLSDGKSVEVTPEHPFYTLSPSGFLVSKKAASVKVGDKIAVAGVLKSLGRGIDEMKDELLSLLARNPACVATLDVQFESYLRRYENPSSINALRDANAASRAPGFEQVTSKYSRLSELLQICVEIGADSSELYDNIDRISYLPSDEYCEISRLGLRLPKSSSEFEELIYLLGLLCGKGHVADFAETEDFIEARVVEICERVLRVSVKQEYLLHSFLSDVYGSRRGQESYANIPDLVSTSRNEYLASFLRGLFDSSGRIDDRRGCLCIQFGSEEFARRLALLLLRFGISATQSIRRGRATIRISGPDLKKFENLIGFGEPAKKIALRKLIVDNPTSQGGADLPLDPLELATMRVILGLDLRELGAGYDPRFESGERGLSCEAMVGIVKIFEQQLGKKKGLATKMHVLQSFAQGSGQGGRPASRLSARHDSTVRFLVEEGLIRKAGNRLRLTSFGRDILLAWKSLLGGQQSTQEAVAQILEQWRALSRGEVKFASVDSVERRRGRFSVYDLTVPETHTYVANGVIVHNTTTSDSLLAACGMLSPSVAGQALALDYMPLEQQRQMTIKAANVTLYNEYEGKPYVFNMIDTPGHIDFTGKVTRSLRAIDGAVVVVDSVEGVMTQTETVTRQALEERVRPVLYINKIDRLVKELRLTPDKMQSWLANIIGDFNNLVNLYAEPEFRDKWKVSIQEDSVAFGSSKDKWGFNLNMAKKSGMSFKDVYDAYTTGDPKTLAERSPLHEAILTMVIKHHPPPQLAQSYRIPKIWHGDLNSEVGKALLTCDENGPTVMMITNVVVDPQAGIVATGRLFSGTVRDGDTVYLVDAKREGRIQSVNMYMGNVREIVSALPAGNIPALLGLEYARSGETIASTKGIVPFESIKYVSEPVVTVAIEAKNPRDLPKLVDSLQKMHIEDPNLIVKINEESGETLMSGMGVLHLEIATTLIQQAGLDIITSPPLINYRETIQTKAGPIMSKSPNRHNKIFVRVEPLPEEIVSKIRSGEISETMDRKGIARMLRDMGWDSDEARSVAGVDEKGNILLDQTKGVQFMQESMDSIRAGFDDVMNNGPLAYEYCRGVKVIIHHFVPHEDPAHRTYAQLMPAARRAILGAMLLAQPVLLEPMQGIEVKCPVDLIGAVAGVLSSKRGKLINIQQKEVLAIIEGEIPASETFDLSEVMRGATAGKAVWNLHFKSWSPLPASLQKTVIAQVRKRKGLPEEVPPASDFIDTE
jgi:elongation factor 2